MAHEDGVFLTGVSAMGVTEGSARASADGATWDRAGAVCAMLVGVLSLLMTRADEGGCAHVFTFSLSDPHAGGIVVAVALEQAGDISFR